MCPRPVMDRFLDALRAGNYRHDAATYAGLSPRSVESWMYRGRGGRRDRQASPEYRDFVRTVEEAEAMARVSAVSNLFARGRVDTNAALAWLRTRDPEHWPKDPEVKPADSAVQIIDRSQQVVILSPDEYPDLVARLLAQRRELRALEAPDVQPMIEEAPRGSRHARLAALRVETDDRAV